MKLLPPRLRTAWNLASTAGAKWMADSAMEASAALAFYTIFAISPMFLIVTAIAGLWLDQGQAQEAVFEQVQSLVGTEGGEALEAVVEGAERPEIGTFAAIIAALTLLVGVTTVFVQLQNSLNKVWQVAPKPGRVVWSLIQSRLLSFAMVLAIGFVLLVSLVLSAALAAAGKYFSGLLPGWEVFWQLFNFLFSFAIITLMFALIFKFLPDVKIAWKDVWIGALTTAFLFTAGKFLIGLYLGRSTLASSYGAAGSLVVFLLWVYYSSLILLYGAELTHVYAEKHGSHVRPSRHATWTGQESP